MPARVHDIVAIDAAHPEAHHARATAPQWAFLRRRLRAVRARLHADVRRARRHQPYLWLLLLDRRIRRALRDAIPAHADLRGAAVCGSRHRPDRHRHRRSAARASASRQGAGTLLADGDARRHAASLFADDGLVHDGHTALSARGVVRLVSFISGALGGAAGVLIGLNYNAIQPYMGEMMMLKGFAVIILGGLGDIRGAVLAGLILGILETLTAGYFASSMKDAVGFLLLVLTLWVRPVGLFGRVVAKRA